MKVEETQGLCSGPADAPTRYLRLWPHRHGTDGFFAAVWQKNI
jgi:16S rRNA (cytosine967-C5)-methyltransferase